MVMQVRAKQLVYVLGMGAGQVTRVFPDGSFTVKIGGYGEPHFDSEGKLGTSGIQRVFFADPIVIPPPDNPALWSAYCRLTKVLFAELASLVEKGDVEEI